MDDDVVGAVEAALAGFLDARGVELADIGPDVAADADVLREFVLGGGKRIRPTFAWWGWRGAGGEQHADEVITTLAALELLQAGALIHDDLIDDSRLRRGAPTVHTRFARRHRQRDWLGDSAHFGLAGAVLFGDLALTWADDLFSGGGLPDELLRRARPVWRQMRTEVLIGQYIDMTTQAGGQESPAAALRINRLKTAGYTVGGPLRLGGALGGAEASVLEAYRGFGEDIGVAFQLRDDLLGIYGDPEVTGKPAGDDLREGKRTLLLALALRTANERAAGRLRSAIGDKTLDETGLDEVRALLVEVGAVAAIERRIEELTESALSTLAAATIDDAARARLLGLALSATKRDH